MGRPTNERWKAPGGGVTVDFIISPAKGAPADQRKRVLDENLSAFCNRALHLAFQDKRPVELSGRTLAGEAATRTVNVCGPGAFVVLKALATRGRGDAKDPYDLLFVLRNFGQRYLEDIADALRPHLLEPVVQEAMAILEEDYGHHENLGPMRAAAFVGRPSDVAYRADLAAAVTTLLERLRDAR